MGNILNYVKEITALLAIFGVVVEVVPIKISPLSWIGKRINKEVNDKINNVQAELNDMKYKNAMKDLADVRTRILGYAILIKKGVVLDYNTLQDAQHNLDMYDYYKETYQYMEVNGRKVKINGEIEQARALIVNQRIGDDHHKQTGSME